MTLLNSQSPDGPIANPQDPSAVPRESTVPASDVPNERPRLLICDDESHILRAANIKLTKGGFDVETACDGQAAWESIQRRKPEMLITDFQMPRMNGLDLCRRLRQQPATSDMPIILLTAKGYEFDWDTIAGELWLTKVMAKPFSPRELLQIVQETLGIDPRNS